MKFLVLRKEHHIQASPSVRAGLAPSAPSRRGRRMRRGLLSNEADLPSFPILSKERGRNIPKRHKGTGPFCFCENAGMTMGPELSCARLEKRRIPCLAFAQPPPPPPCQPLLSSPESASRNGTERNALP